MPFKRKTLSELREENRQFMQAELKNVGCRFNWSTQQLCENMGLRRFFE